MDAPIKVKILSNGKMFPLYSKDKISWLLFKSDIGNILLAHGAADGTLACEPMLDNILASNKVDWIHCCYPKQVLDRHPHLADKMIFRTIDGVTCHSGEAIGGGKDKEYVTVTFFPCHANKLEFVNNEWRIKE